MCTTFCQPIPRPAAFFIFVRTRTQGSGRAARGGGQPTPSAAASRAHVSCFTRARKTSYVTNSGTLSLQSVCGKRQRHQDCSPASPSRSGWPRRKRLSGVSCLLCWVCWRCDATWRSWTGWTTVVLLREAAQRALPQRSGGGATPRSGAARERWPHHPLPPPLQRLRRSGRSTSSEAAGDRRARIELRVLASGSADPVKAPRARSAARLDVVWIWAYGGIGLGFQTPLQRG